MKNKIISCLLIVLVLLGICGTKNIYAASDDYELYINVPTAVEPGKELNIAIYTVNVQDGITGVGFTFNYNDSLFDLVNVIQEPGWTVSRLENSYTILTETFEATTNTGKIATIVLKAKSTITTPTPDTITFTDIEVSKDDASVVSLDSITKNTSIEIKNNDNDNTNTVNTNTTNTNTTNTNTTITNTTNTNTTNTNTTNINTTNTTNGETTNKNTAKDDGKVDGKIPQTGDDNFTLVASIVGCLTVGTISVILYRRNLMK